VRRFRAWLAAVVLPGAAACGQAKADVEPLPPLRRPTLEERAGLPRLAGRWLFTGFEYPVGDTQRVREQVYRLVPPCEFAVATQRLDSATELSKRLKAAGFRFVGPTTVYSAMQACGIVNDHVAACHVRDDVERARGG